MMKFKSKDTNVFFTSDLHYHHKNLCRATTDWENKEECRDFTSLDKMDSYLVDQLNKYVGHDDVLFFLGDWSFGGIDRIWEFRSRLVCQNIHFILGNHDQHIEADKKVNGLRVDISSALSSGPAGLLLIEGNDETDDTWEASFHNIFSSVSHYKEISIDGQQINMSHFPMISWNRSFKGAWMLHGHCHGTLFTNASIQWGGSDYWYKSSKILDVGIDNVFKMTGEYKPLSFQEIRKVMNSRDLYFTDHHDARTEG